MEDNQLINKIKQLKQIKPKEKWALLAKNQILEQEQELPEPVLKTELTSFFAFFRKPAFAFTAAITLVVLLIGAIAGFFYLGEGEQPAEIVKTPAELEEQLARTEQAQAINLALREVQLEVVQATEFLKKIEEPQKILEARNAVVPTIEAVREVIVEAEKLEPGIEDQENQILAVKTDIDKLENTLDEMTAIQASRLIQYWETRTLTEIQKQVLEQAKMDYQNGYYNIALINAIFVSQLDK